MIEEITNAIYVQFWLPIIKKEILWIPTPDWCSLQWKYIDLSFLANSREVKLWKLFMGIPIGRSWSSQDVWIIQNYVCK